MPEADDSIGVVKLDPWLEPFKGVIHRRYKKAQDWIKNIDGTEGGIEKFSRVSVSFRTSLGTMESLMLDVLHVGYGNLRIQCRCAKQHHLSRMGSECRRRISHWRI